MQQAVAVKPGAVHYRNKLASLYAENGQPVRAQETLQQLIADFLTYVKGYINLALVTYNLGKHLSSAPHFEHMNSAANLPDLYLRSWTCAWACSSGTPESVSCLR